MGINYWIDKQCCGNCIFFKASSEYHTLSLRETKRNGHCHMKEQEGFKKPVAYPYCKFTQCCCYWKTKLTVDERLKLLEKAIHELQEKTWF